MSLLTLVTDARRLTQRHQELATTPEERARHEATESKLRHIERIVGGATDQALVDPVVARIEAVLEAAQLARLRCVDEGLPCLALWRDSDAMLTELLATLAPRLR